MFDVNFVMDNYGLSGFYSYLNGQHSPRIASLLLLTQFAAGYFSYFVSKTFYSFGLHFKHIEALEGNCSSDLTVAIIYGSVVEAIGLLSCKIAEHFIDETLIDEKYVTIVLSAISGLITILGINLTGMYANPIVAWALTFNCGEVTHFAHFIVYWLAPLFAFFLSKWLL
uniref:Aquaporin n=1 Tax=Meloidogyne incognita TaxID=6306 RepID=A0A914NPF8_MELIC